MALSLRRNIRKALLALRTQTNNEIAVNGCTFSFLFFYFQVCFFSLTNSRNMKSKGVLGSQDTTSLPRFVKRE